MFRDIEENEGVYWRIALLGTLFGPIVAFVGLLMTVDEVRTVNRYGGTNGVHVSATVVSAQETRPGGKVSALVEYTGHDGAAISTTIVMYGHRPPVGSHRQVVYARRDPSDAIDAGRLRGPLGTDRMLFAILILAAGTGFLLLGPSSAVALFRLWRRRRMLRHRPTDRVPSRDLTTLKLWIDDG